MADIVLHNVTPQPGDVLSVPIAVQYGLAQGGLVVGEPTDATCPAWDEAGDQGPIAEGSRAHIFVAPAWHPIQNATLGTVYSDGDFLLDILNTIRSIKSNNMPLSNFAAKLGNAYCYDYTNPYTRGCAVSLTDKDYSGMKTRFSMTRIGLASGRIDASGYNASNYGTWYYKIASALASAGWTQDGVNKSNMYEGFSKDISTGDVYRYDINNTKSALDPADVETHTVECYRGLFFAEDPYNAGELSAGDILVVVDWDDEMEYTIYDGDDPDTGLPTMTTTLGPKATFAIGWRDPGSYTTRLQVSQDPDYEYSRMIDLYPPAAAEEFNFIALGGGGGGGNGHGGRAVTSDIPMRITSRSDVDYRHFLDLYDETNYNERNMFLTNFVGRIPYKLVDYDSSEAGGTGVIRVSTDLQFTHFVGASFSDGNVPRVYEVVSHKSMGGSPNVLLCTFRVCHLKDYFQHFGVTSENEFLVERSTVSSLYNPWLEDARIFGDDYSAERFTFGDYAYDPRVMVVLNDNRVFTWPLGNVTDTMVPAFIPGVSTIYNVSSYRGLLNAIETVDNDPRASLGQTSFVSALLSRIRAVYMVPSQMDYQGSPDDISIKVTIPYYSDPSDPTSLTSAEYTLNCNVVKVIYQPEQTNKFNMYFTQTTGGTLFNDWTDINATWYMNIPWYGGLSLSGTQIKRLLDYGSGGLYIRYFISAFDGTITVASSFSDEGPAELLPWKRLPTVAVPTSARTLSYRIANAQNVAGWYNRNEQATANMITTGATAAMATVGAAAMGNYLAAGASVIGGVAGIVGINVSNDIKNRYSLLGSNMAAASITAEAMTCNGYEINAIQDVILIRVKRAEIINIYDAVGYPCRVRWRSVGAVNGGKYWVSILGNIRGTSAYAQAVRGEIERDGIIYNYS